MRFTLDEWMLRLHPELSIHDPAYGMRADALRELIWSIAAQVLRSGTDAVLDWNSWSSERREWAVGRARGIGAEVILHRLTTSLEESTRRARRREAAGTAYAHPVDRDGNEHLARLLQEPDTARGWRSSFTDRARLRARSASCRSRKQRGPAGLTRRAAPSVPR